MKLTGLGIALGAPGQEQLLGVTPQAGLSVVPSPNPETSAALIAAAWRAALSRPVPEPGLVAVTVRAEAQGIAFTLLDRGVDGSRVLLEGAPGALPRALELDPEAMEPRTLDGLREEVLRRLAHAAGLREVAHFAAALAQAEPSAAPAGEGAPAERAYVAARRRAESLASAVRALDDQMTRSVVPDWIWIATGAGGVGVLLTVVALMYPELRVALVIALMLLSVIGFGLYGWRAYGELGTRARLLEARAEQRAAREQARAEAAEWANRLRAEGGDPDGALLRLEGVQIPASLPAILGLEAPSLAALEALAGLGRQVVVVCERLPEGVDPRWISRFLEEARPPE